ncbi:MAG: M1 family aminopeptidase [Bacteroidota bacterium]
MPFTKKIYDDLKARDKDKALVFPNWIATRDNRNVVYYKGAYVLHLLREKLGAPTFWKGIQVYSQRFDGKAVETNDFKSTMEEVAKVGLDDFFNQWVYKN